MMTAARPKRQSPIGETYHDRDQDHKDQPHQQTFLNWLSRLPASRYFPHDIEPMDTLSPAIGQTVRP
jgi:hypothetical protein